MKKLVFIFILMISGLASAQTFDFTCIFDANSVSIWTPDWDPENTEAHRSNFTQSGTDSLGVSGERTVYVRLGPVTNEDSTERFYGDLNNDGDRDDNVSRTITPIYANAYSEGGEYVGNTSLLGDWVVTNVIPDPVNQAPQIVTWGLTDFNNIPNSVTNPEGYYIYDSADFNFVNVRFSDPDDSSNVVEFEWGQVVNGQAALSSFHTTNSSNGRARIGVTNQGKEGELWAVRARVRDLVNETDFTFYIQF